MRKDKLKRIEAKIKLRMPLTKEEIAYHILFAKELNVEVLNAGINL